jgi:hypothetical protein
LGLGRAVRRHSDNLNLSEIFFAPQRRGFVLSFVPYSEQFPLGTRGIQKDFTGARGLKTTSYEEGH